MAFVGMPTVFYGDELGIEGISELDYRAPMPWGGGDGELQGFFRRAIALRHERAELRRGNFRVVSAERGSGLFAFERRFGCGSVTVCLNASEERARMPEIGGAPLWAEGLEGGVLGPFGFAVFGT